MVARARPARSLRRRSAFFAIGGALFIVVVEIGSWALFRAAGETFSYERLDRERASVAGGTDDLAAPRRTPGAADLVLHPHLGYAAPPDRDAVVGDDRTLPSNRFGFLDRNDPIVRRGDNRLVVGVLGGSVAVLLCELGADALRDELQRSPRFRDHEIVVACLAVGGFKQPQQLMALNYVLARGAEFDVVVNLDGVNEVAISEERRRRGVDPLLPWKWDVLTDPAPSQEFLRRAGEIVYLRGERRQLAAAFSGPLVSRSVALQLCWRLADRRRAREIAARTADLATFQQHEGAAPEAPSRDAMLEAVADLWVRASIQLDSLCRGLDIRYLHCLQPSQYVAGTKPIGPEERAVAVHPDPDWVSRAAVEHGYPKLVQRSAELRARGVRFVDLRSVFAGVERPLYMDTMCHFSRAGTRILARRIAAEILDLEEPPRGELLRIEVPDRVQVRSPVDAYRIEVTGVFAGGQRRPLRWAHTGTTYACDSELFRVSADGEVVARDAGRATASVVHGALRATVRLVADWGPVVPFGRGIAAQRGRVPVLRATGGPPRAGSVVQLEVTGSGGAGSGGAGSGGAGSGAGSGYVVFGSRPARHLLGWREVYVDPQGPRHPLRHRGGSEWVLSYRIPDDPALRGTRVFCQAFLHGPGSPGGQSVSNALMLTIQ